MNQKMYDGHRKERIFKGELMIPPQSIYEQIVAEFIEDGLGQKAAKYFVNQLLRKEGKEIMGPVQLIILFFSCTPRRSRLIQSHKATSALIQLGKKQASTFVSSLPFVLAS